MRPTELCVRPIGTISTEFASKYSAPRQPGTAAKRSIGIITLNPGSNFEQALKDLEGFEYVWVLFWFHENTTWKPLVLPPVGDRKKRGVFSTRSPHRPNPIGLSLCRLLEVKGRTVRIADPDMLDGTPIVDLKPYVPHVEAHPRARSGWIAATHERTRPRYRVIFSSAVSRTLRGLPIDERSTIRDYVRTTLARDPFPHVYRRIKLQPDGSWIIAVRRWRFSYRITGRRVDVTVVDRV